MLGYIWRYLLRSFPVLSLNNITRKSWDFLIIYYSKGRPNKHHKAITWFSESQTCYREH